MSFSLLDCTILVLTKDRVDFLKRFLRFYMKIDNIAFVILDGSEHEPTYGSWGLPQNIQYYYFGADTTIKKFVDKTKFALDKVDTKYVMLSSDDDFFSPIAIKSGINYLEENPAFVAHSNLALDFTLTNNKGNELYGEIHNLRLWNLTKDNIEETPSERILSYLTRKGSLWHSIARIDCMRDTWKWIGDSEPKRFETVEILLNIGLLKFGRVRSESSNILVFHQVHQRMIAKSIKNDSQFFSDLEWNTDLLESLDKFLRLSSLQTDFKDPEKLISIFFRHSEPIPSGASRKLNRVKDSVQYRLTPRRVIDNRRKQRTAEVELNIPSPDVSSWQAIRNFLRTNIQE